MVLLGTRPEAVKLAPIILGLNESEHFEPVVVATAQHREMLDQVTSLFRIEPDVDLDIMRPRQTLTDVTTRALDGAARVMAEHAPDVVVVQGDTTTTFVSALAAHYHETPVVHVEAGLRTFERYSPFPEEMNRRLTTSLTSLHLAPTHVNRANLLREGVEPASVVVTGNTVIDALLWAVEQDQPYGEPALRSIDDDLRRVLLVTAHRRESWGEPLASVGRALARLARDNADLLVVLPIHLNPAVRDVLLPPLRGLSNVVVTEPLDYGSFVRMINRAHIVLTDSGGIQEEAPSLRRPVLVMRESTERPEAIQAGTARLVGTAENDVVDAVSRLLHDPSAYAAMARAVNPYGDGRAAARSIDAIAHYCGLGPPVEEFRSEPEYARAL